MSEQTDVARPGDEVQAVIKGRVLTVDDHGRVMSLKVAGESANGLYVPASAAVEVLERADDPSADPIGTYRREDYEDGFSIFQAAENRAADRYWLCVYSTAAGNRGLPLSDSDVVGARIVGALPGSPADVPPVTAEDIDRWAEQDAGDSKQARRDASWSKAPRVFSSDGPEPPVDVLVLKRLNPDDPTRWPYLLRSGGGWEWSPTAHRRIPGIHANPTTWRAAVCSNGGRFQEVTP